MKKIIACLASMTLISLSLSNPAFAYSKKDEQTIKKDIETMQQALTDSDHDTFLAVMPERFLQALAKEHNISMDQLKELLKLSLSMINDLDAQFEAHTDKIKPYKSSTGRDYALIPTTTLMGDAGEIVIEGNTLAIKDNGKWYYLQYQKEHETIIKKAFPDIKQLP